MRSPHPFYVGMGAVLYPLFGWGPLGIKVYGEEHIPAEGGFILASTHLSYFDSYVLARPFWPRRQLRYMAKAELYRWPLKTLLNTAGAFPVRRGERDVEAYRTAVRLVQGGEIVVVYPTGRREKVSRRLNEEIRPHPGAARIALTARVPLVPAAIFGSDRLPRPARMRIAFGPAVAFDDLAGLPPRESAKTATERMFAAMTSLAEFVAEPSAV